MGHAGGRSPGPTEHSTRGVARLVVLSGPSGVGKGSVVSRARVLDPTLWVSVSATTRAPRPGEVPGQHYFFMSRDEFESALAAGEMLESAEFAGNLYGTPREPVRRMLAEGRSVLLEIELQGARQVREREPAAFLVFLRPPSFEELARRLRGRGTESAETVAHRLEIAREELAAESEFDAVVVNDDLQAAAERLLELVQSHT